MCGIVGYIGEKSADLVILVGLEKLEYRGYDSAGLSLITDDGRLLTIKKKGRIKDLADAVEAAGIPEGHVGIGHTRWATHGRVSDENAHPHLDCRGEIAVVHNGIIENFDRIRARLLEGGHCFTSDTDTEVIAHLIEDYYRGSLVEAVSTAVRELEGTFAIAVLSSREPDVIVAARKDSPLVLGIGDGEMLLASDIPALLSHTKRVVIMENGEVAELRRDRFAVFDFEGNPKEKEIKTVEWDAITAQKGHFPHFMIKEIHEQPDICKENLARYLREDEFVLLKDTNLRKLLLNKNRIFIQAAGTSLHAGRVGKYLLEQMVRLPAEADFASEFVSRNPPVDEKTLAVAISQSGETMDTLEALRYAKQKGLEVLSIVNVVDSSIARESDYVMYINAGPEIGVASTKAYTAQLLILSILAFELSHLKGFLSDESARQLITELYTLPSKMTALLATESHIMHIAEKYYSSGYFMFLGRGINYPTALEGALKLKEISYIHATGYAAGEMKHGPLALVDANLPVVIINPKGPDYEKTFSNAKEVSSRHGRIISVVTEGDERHKDFSEEIIQIPETHPLLSPILAIIPLQLLAYHIAVLRGCDVDKPRNLAKVVTVG
ncbi:MAG: glutamine--fructose-6-phosphate transaminase (isomerizing) [candidate division WOR-3 bacterium]